MIIFHSMIGKNDYLKDKIYDIFANNGIFIIKL